MLNFLELTECVVVTVVWSFLPKNLVVHIQAQVQVVERQQKKKKYFQVCLDQNRPYSPFVVSCDRVLGNKAKVVQEAGPQPVLSFGGPQTYLKIEQKVSVRKWHDTIIFRSTISGAKSIRSTTNRLILGGLYYLAK